MQELHDRAAAERVARLATVDPDGRLHVVPITFVLAGDTLYSAVDAKPKRSRTLRRIENARARPDVTVLVDHYEDDWTQLWWLRLRGRARVPDGGEEAERPSPRSRAARSTPRRPRGLGARRRRRRLARLVWLLDRLALEPARAALCRVRFTVLRRGGRNEAGEEPGRRRRHFVDGPLERLRVRLRGLREAADLADVLGSAAARTSSPEASGS